MAYISHNYGFGTTANDYARVDDKRAKVKRDCWVCGADAQGKFCGPCSADVYDARTAGSISKTGWRRRREETMTREIRNGIPTNTIYRRHLGCGLHFFTLVIGRSGRFLARGFLTKRVAVFFWFVGWKEFSVGAHFSLATCNFDLHIPFGFITIAPTRQEWLTPCL